jgi:hypothetical protein
MGSSKIDLEQARSGVSRRTSGRCDCPFGSAKLGSSATKESKPASVCDSAVPKKKRARPSLAGEPELSGVHLYE